MDPVTVMGLTASVASILDVLAKSLTALFGLVTRFKQAALSIQLIASQLSTLRSALSQLLQWMRFAPVGLQGNSMLLHDLHTSISACELLIKTLDSEIHRLNADSSGSIKSSRKLMIAFDKTFKERQLQLNHQVTALNLLLQAINWCAYLHLPP